MAKNKSEIEQELASRVGLSLESVRQVIDSLAEMACEQAEAGFYLRGFGEFRIFRGKGKQGTNPFTGKPITFKAPPEMGFSPDSTAQDRFVGRKGKPVQHTWETKHDTSPIPEVHLAAVSKDSHLNEPVVKGFNKIGGNPDWIQADETPVCCGSPTRFCGQLDIADKVVADMIYVFFCSKCYMSSSVAQVS